MPSARKYHGPCPVHPKKISGCRHCNAYYMQRRYHGGNEPPAKDYDGSFQMPAHARHSVQIYRGLHWPAPERT